MSLTPSMLVIRENPVIMLHFTWKKIILLVLYQTWLVGCQQYAERELPADTVPFYEDYATDEYDFSDDGDVYRWNVDEYPHPQVNPRFCNRMKSSYICDPDLTIEKYEADDLDSSIHQLYSRTPCICNKCPSDNGGIIIGIALLKYIFQPYNEHPSKTIRRYTEKLRSRWKLGQCDNDILIVVATEDRLSYTDVGQSTSEYVSLQTAHSIFLENKAFFTGRQFYDGLKAMLIAYNDSTSIMASTRRRDDGVDVAVVSGSIIGAIILIGIIIFLFIIIRHWMTSKKDETENKVPATQESHVPSSWRPNYIKKMYDSYKSNRRSKKSSSYYKSRGTDDVDNEDVDSKLEEEIIDTTLQICPAYVPATEDSQSLKMASADDYQIEEMTETPAEETEVLIEQPQSLLAERTGDYKGDITNL